MTVKYWSGFHENVNMRSSTLCTLLILLEVHVIDRFAFIVLIAKHLTP